MAHAPPPQRTPLLLPPSFAQLLSVLTVSRHASGLSAHSSNWSTKQARRRRPEPEEDADMAGHIRDGGRRGAGVTRRQTRIMCGQRAAQQLPRCQRLFLLCCCGGRRVVVPLRRPRREAAPVQHGVRAGGAGAATAMPPGTADSTARVWWGGRLLEEHEQHVEQMIEELLDSDFSMEICHYSGSLLLSKLVFPLIMRSQ
ncbi:hypothetical protein VPH35_118853 [Triticum aestivum]|uniref:Uncharacterized protein n=1 Tax=Aegilops tauschii TaxID=37682 RepID=M8BI63_AEGTA